MSPDEIVIPASTRIRINGEAFKLVEDAPATAALVPAKSQINPRVGYACQVEPCATTQKERNRGHLLTVWVTPGPVGRLWVPSCGNPDCGLPMSVYQDPRANKSEVA